MVIELPLELGKPKKGFLEIPFQSSQTTGFASSILFLKDWICYWYLSGISRIHKICLVLSLYVQNNRVHLHPDSMAPIRWKWLVYKYINNWNWHGEDCYVQIWCWRWTHKLFPMSVVVTMLSRCKNSKDRIFAYCSQSFCIMVLGRVLLFSWLRRFTFFDKVTQNYLCILSGVATGNPGYIHSLCSENSCSLEDHAWPN